MKKYKVRIFQWGWLFPLLCVLALPHSVDAQQWTQKADMVNPRLFFSVVAVEKEIYVVGGMLAAPIDSVEAYMPETDTWHQKASLPTPRAGVATCVVDGKMYAIGGWDAENPAVGTVTEYDPGTDTWTQKAEMPTPRSFFTAVAVEHLIYTFGGVAQNVGPVLATMEVYDTRTDTWAEKAEMPQTRSGMAATVFRDKIYLIGGVENIQGPAVKTVVEYDPKTDTWTQKAEMPTARTALAVSQGGAKIYAIGGTGIVQGPGLTALEIYDPITDIMRKAQGCRPHGCSWAQGLSITKSTRSAVWRKRNERTFIYVRCHLTLKCKACYSVLARNFTCMPPRGSSSPRCTTSDTSDFGSGTSVPTSSSYEIYSNKFDRLMSSKKGAGFPPHAKACGFQPKDIDETFFYPDRCCSHALLLFRLFVGGRSLGRAGPFNDRRHRNR